MRRVRARAMRGEAIERHGTRKTFASVHSWRSLVVSRAWGRRDSGRALDAEGSRGVSVGAGDATTVSRSRQERDADDRVNKRLTLITNFARAQTGRRSRSRDVRSRRNVWMPS
jgi:hypothetical protein